VRALAGAPARVPVDLPTSAALDGP
jgi:hypothetical protein